MTWKVATRLSPAQKAAKTRKRNALLKTRKALSDFAEYRRRRIASERVAALARKFERKPGVAAALDKVYKPAIAAPPAPDTYKIGLISAKIPLPPLRAVEIYLRKIEDSPSLRRLDANGKIRALVTVTDIESGDSFVEIRYPDELMEYANSIDTEEYSVTIQTEYKG